MQTSIMTGKISDFAPTLTQPLHEPLFETGIVAQPDREVYAHFNVPSSLMTLPCGRLLVLFNAHAADLSGKQVLGAYSDDEGQTWSEPEVFFNNQTPSPHPPLNEKHFADGVIVVVNEKRVLLFAVSPRVEQGKHGSSSTVSWRRVSDDGGRTFGPMEEASRHRRYFVGTVHPGLRLQRGSLILGYSWDIPSEQGLVPNGEGEMEPCSGVIISRDEGQSWSAGADIRVRAPKGTPHLPRAITGIAEPAVVELPDGRLFLLGRTGTNYLWQSFSHDGGLSWEPAVPSPLESHNCPAALLRLSSDGATLAVFNYDLLLRRHLSACISTDGCQSWSTPQPLCLPEFADLPSTSYPALCELSDETILCVFAQRDDDNPQSAYLLRSVRFNRAYCEDEGAYKNGRRKMPPM